MRIPTTDKYGNTRYRTCRKGKRKTSYYHWCLKTIWLRDIDGGTFYKWCHTPETDEEKAAINKFVDNIVGLTVAVTLCEASPEFALLTKEVYGL